MRNNITVYKKCKMYLKRIIKYCQLIKSDVILDETKKKLQ